MGRTRAKAAWLAGKRVALAGRLASMTRREAARLIAAHGGRFARTITSRVDIVVVGRDGWPLSRDGLPVRKLRRARTLAERGHAIQVLPEEELLERLHRAGGLLHRHSTLRELGDLLAIPAERLQAWLRSGLIRPASTVDGIRYFDFPQVAGAKSLCELVRAGISTATLRHSLRQLSVWLGSVEYSLSQLTTLERGSRLVVRLSAGQLAEPGGQLLFDFLADPQAPPVSLPWASEARSAEEWFELGFQAEQQADWAGAVRAYRQSLLAGGPSAETSFHLAGALYSLGSYARAGERYRQVLEIDPDFWEAWNNLGTVLAYDHQHEEAVAAYRRALQLNPQYADAHYNLADTLEDLSQWDEALAHWRTYLQLEPQGQWAEHARHRVRYLERR